MMLADFLSWVRRERIYVILGLIVTCFYATAYVKIKSEKDVAQQESATRLQMMEERFQEKIKDKQAMEAFLKEHPEVQRKMSGSFLLIFVSFGMGIFLLIRWLSKPEFRQKWTVAPDWEGGIGSLTVLFRVTVMMLSISLLLTFVLSGLKRFLFPETSEHFWVLFHVILVHGVTLALIFIYTAPYRKNLAQLGFGSTPEPWWREITASAGGYLTVIPLFSLVLMILMTISRFTSFEPEPHPLVFVFLDEAGNKSLIYFSLVLAIFIAPIFEEIFFRGFCYRALLDVVGKPAAMVISASIFAVVHGSVYAFWPIFVLGLGLVYLYDLRKSLAAPILLLHFF